MVMFYKFSNSFVSIFSVHTLLLLNLAAAVNERCVCKSDIGRAAIYMLTDHCKDIISHIRDDIKFNKMKNFVCDF